MRLPWVSRELYDEKASEAFRLSVECESLKANLSDGRRRVDELTERLLSYKMVGAVEVPKLPDMTPVTPLVAEPYDEMRALIHARSGGNLRKRAMMLAQLDVDRAAGVQDDVIEHAILSGVESSGVPA